jgi:hypothetical protein
VSDERFAGMNKTGYVTALIDLSKNDSPSLLSSRFRSGSTSYRIKLFIASLDWGKDMHSRDDVVTSPADLDTFLNFCHTVTNAKAYVVILGFIPSMRGKYLDVIRQNHE